MTMRPARSPSKQSAQKPSDIAPSDPGRFVESRAGALRIVAQGEGDPLIKPADKESGKDL